ncbi:hypothetical protein [Kitasatospora sp. NPDC096204]|uniref:hypothetical protein n=1 Tax=Kitasatospora sp. NPDC096204 TaxID=3364094 RepID=UPI0038097CC2
MRRSSWLAGTILLLTAGLATACTNGDTPPQGGDGPWALDGLAATSVDGPIQRSIDAPPSKGVAKILGVAGISGTNVILSVRDGACQVALLPAVLTESTTTAPTSLGSPRPAGRTGSSDSRQEFPGTILEGKYTLASARLDPFKFATVGCSEKAMTVRIEGVGEASMQKKSGDSLQLWKESQDAVLAVGFPEAIHGPVLEHSTS